MGKKMSFLYHDRYIIFMDRNLVRSNVQMYVAFPGITVIYPPRALAQRELPVCVCVCVCGCVSS